MLAVDTNVVVRYLTNDDARQARIARRLIDENKIRLLHTVLLETEWVLRSLYGYGRTQIHAGLTAFIGLDNVTLGEPDEVARALAWFEQGVDFADALHLAAADQCTAFVTFDRKLVAAARKAQAGKAKAL
jgi:predicted nucleic-acid-binding protein